MKIGLINAIPLHALPVTHRYSQTLSLPLGILYVATYLLSQEPGVQVLIKDDIDNLLDEGIDLLGVYSVTQNFGYAREIAAMAKDKGIVTVVGGPHITAIPNLLPSEFDFGVVGEGEETFRELVRGLIAGLPVQDEKWKTTPGILYHDRHAGTYFGGRRHQKKNLDLYPFPRRELWAKHLGVAHMMTSRGCPFSCSYCSEPVLWDAYRMHSPQYVVDEIQAILSHYRLPHIMFFDDIFTISISRIRSLVELMESAGIPSQIAFTCWGRTQLINEEMVALMKRMNIVHVSLGIESASQRVLSDIKRGATVEAHQRAIDLCHAAGFKISASFVVASPHETAEELQMTYDFIDRNQEKFSGVEINPAVPLPGTPLWQYAKEKGLVSDDMDWGKLADWSILDEFDLNRYVVTNEHFFEPGYQAIFKRLYELYRDILDKGEAAEQVLRYLNPTMEPARFL